MSAFDGPLPTDTVESGPGSNAGSGVIGGGGEVSLGATVGLTTVAFCADGVVVVVSVGAGLVVADGVALAADGAALGVTPVEEATDDGAGDAELEV